MVSSGRTPGRRRGRRPSDKTEPVINRWVANGILIVAAGMCLANFVFGVVLENYEQSEAINGVLLALVAGIFALKGKA